MKTTRTAVTHKERTAIDAQPLPRLNPQTAREEKLFNLTDGRVVVEWLNAAKKARSSGYERVVSIRRQLVELRSLRVRLTEYGTDSSAWKKAYRQLEKQRALVKAGKKGREVGFPAIDTDSPEYKRLYRQTERLHSAVNEALCRYAFRPRVTYFVASGVWRGGMVPDDNSRLFVTSVSGQTISEADAALSLVRLDLIGEIERVRLCENCQARWFARAKSNYRFCRGDDCREEFYAKDPGYHPRKAANQRAYRKRLKQQDALAGIHETAYGPHPGHS
jgi:hypothetical protein